VFLPRHSSVLHQAISHTSGRTTFQGADQNAIEYTVETISLTDLLDQRGAPTEIDYFSIDTEGSELEILEAFDFSRWRFNAITVEHNYVSASRNAIYDILTANGYTRVCTELAQWDDWYVGTAGAHDNARSAVA
jgi:hypothetical protein